MDNDNLDIIPDNKPEGNNRNHQKSAVRMRIRLSRQLITLSVVLIIFILFLTFYEYMPFFGSKNKTWLITSLICFIINVATGIFGINFATGLGAEGNWSYIRSKKLFDLQFFAVILGLCFLTAHIILRSPPPNPMDLLR